MIFFTADHHYGHENIIRLCKRPFATSDEMDEEMIRRWNERVGADDEVYHLGDFSFRSGRADPIIAERLNGRIHLIWGNHDSSRIKRLSRWASSQPYAELKIGRDHLVLCHYKFEVFNRCQYGAIQLYGHSHGTLPGNSQQLDVGVDCWNFRPITLDEIKQRLHTLSPMRRTDHHRPATTALQSEMKCSAP
jgi:calcineurin-like phosphoesterase family protein